MCFADHNNGTRPAAPINHNEPLLPPPKTDPRTKQKIPRPEDPTLLKICRLDAADLYYESQLESPRFTALTPSPSKGAELEGRYCSNCRAETDFDAFLNDASAIAAKLDPARASARSTASAAAAARTETPPGIRRECIARALQRGHAIRNTTSLTKCASPTATAQNRAELPPHCPTKKLVGFLQDWANAALRCMDPSGSANADVPYLRLNPEFIFALINHESGWNMNATSRIGNGYMQLTTAPMREFLSSRPNLKQYWSSVRDKPECEPFRGPVDAYTRFPGPTWRCSVTHPRRIGLHFIIGLSNLNACQRAVSNETQNRFKFAQVLSVARNGKSKKGGKPQIAEAEEQRIIDDLVAVCHNWGVGNMKTAFRAIRRARFKDANEFRAKLLSTGWAFSGRSGTRNFPRKVEADLKLIKRGNAAIGNKELKTCVE